MRLFSIINVLFFLRIIPKESSSFSIGREIKVSTTRTDKQRRGKVSRFLKASSANSDTTSMSLGLSLRSYEHDGYKLTYQYKPASPKYEKHPPILLVHPVGIGLACWYWKRVMSSWKEGPSVYAVDLIGCGVANGADAWDPDLKGMPIPLGWVKGCEALLNQVILPQTRRISLFGIKESCVVAVQGGLAPVGVQLASRNPNSVSHLILTSPPTWNEMVTPVPEIELERNYGFLRNKQWGNLAFKCLETRAAVEFFSNAFLFGEKCDEEWLDECGKEMGISVRPPVQVFNAGFCLHRSWQTELENMVQPMLILQGDQDDQRLEKREAYEANVPNCQLQTLPGKNMLPWESAEAVVESIEAFVARET